MFESIWINQKIFDMYNDILLLCDKIPIDFTFTNTKTISSSNATKSY